MGAALALLASVSWGVGDFFGGTMSRRLHPLVVLRASQSIALVALFIVAIVAGELGASGYLVWGVLGGIVGLVSLGCFYAALAAGTMGVVAPVAATGVIVPVVIGMADEGAPAAAQIVGIVLAVIGVTLASGPERSVGVTAPNNRRPLLLAGVAALGFGLTLTLVAEGSEHSVAMTLLSMRVVNVAIGSAILATVLRHTTRTSRRDLPLLAVIGATDAGANGLYALSTQMGLVSVSAVLASLYPAVTALLAWRIHQEHLKRVQVVGVAATLSGVALIAAGGA